MPAGLIDTHSHLDCPAFDKDRAELVHEARTAGVTDILVCAGFPAGFEAARSAAHTYGPQEFIPFFSLKKRKLKRHSRPLKTF